MIKIVYKMHHDTLQLSRPRVLYTFVCFMLRLQCNRFADKLFLFRLLFALFAQLCFGIPCQYFHKVTVLRKPFNLYNN